MLSDDVDWMDSILNECFHPNGTTADVWRRIKTALEEAQKPSPNTGSPKLLAIADVAYSALMDNDVDLCKSFLVALRNQLRAGA